MKPIEKYQQKFIDLGLPSGTLWAEQNEEGYFTFDEAKEKFGDSVPSIELWDELRTECKWEWDDKKKGYNVTGPNGNNIFLPAAGRRGDTIHDAGSYGYYGSSSLDAEGPYFAWYLYFCSGYAGRGFYYCCYGRSIRLVKQKENGDNMKGENGVDMDKRETIDKNYIDLGLPSGTLWAEQNEEGHYTFDEAKDKFGDSVPSIELWVELQKECNWKWDKEKKGSIVTGPNGNSIFLPAAGIRNFSANPDYIGSGGYYWSSSLDTNDPDYAWEMCFNSNIIGRDNYIRCYGHSVRLVKQNSSSEFNKETKEHNLHNGSVNKELIVEKHIQDEELDEFTQNIRSLIINKLTTTTKSEFGTISSTIFIDDETAKDIANGVLFYAAKEALKNPERKVPDKYDGMMDVECIRLCDALNELPSLKTFESCCGHLKQRYSIWFFCQDIGTLSRLARCVDRNYSDGMWEICADSTDSHPYGVFWLRSKRPFETYEKMEESINFLIKNINHWFDKQFDDYFATNKTN